jgi:hypothetical protein
MKEFSAEWLSNVYEFVQMLGCWRTPKRQMVNRFLIFLKLANCSQFIFIFISLSVGWALVWRHFNNKVINLNTNGCRNNGLLAGRAAQSLPSGGPIHRPASD